MQIVTIVISATARDTRLYSVSPLCIDQSVAKVASPKPINTITGPTITLGNSLCNHCTPANLIAIDTPTLTSPTTIKPIISAIKLPCGAPPSAKQVVITGISAALEPRYTGERKPVISRYNNVPTPELISAAGTIFIS